jgi:ATP-dependent Clp protease ATP-binding subunit ClpX
VIIYRHREEGEVEMDRREGLVEYIKDYLTEDGVITFYGEQGAELTEEDYMKRWEEYKYMEIEMFGHTSQSFLTSPEVEEFINPTIEEIKKLKTPKQMKKILDTKIYGNEELKKQLTTTIYRKLVSLITNEVSSFEINDGAIPFIYGETGSGKTATLKAISELTDTPVYVLDMSQVSPSSYKGNSLEESLVNLFNGDRLFNDNATKIIFCDEVDKLVARARSTDDVGVQVMNELLKLVEEKGQKTIGSSGMPGSKITIRMDTLIWIFGGSCAGVLPMVQERLNKNKKAIIGFSSNVSETKKEYSDEELYKNITKEDLRAFGFSRELMGRIGIIVGTDKLSTNSIMKIMELQGSAYKQTQDLFNALGKSFSLTKEAKEYVSELSLKLKSGARGLSEVLYGITNDIVYNIDDYEEVDIVVDVEMIKNILDK